MSEIFIFPTTTEPVRYYKFNGFENFGGSMRPREFEIDGEDALDAVRKSIGNIITYSGIGKSNIKRILLRNSRNYNDLLKKIIELKIFFEKEGINETKTFIIHPVDSQAR